MFSGGGVGSAITGSTTAFQSVVGTSYEEPKLDNALRYPIR